MVDTKTKLCLFVSTLFVIGFIILVSMVSSRKILNKNTQNNITTAGMTNSQERNGTARVVNLRQKRESEDRYANAAKMSQMKMLRAFLQMFANMFGSTYVGGAHPFHHEVPKPVVKAYKDKVSDFLFPKKKNTEEASE